MTLTTHAITGATLATLVPNYPILGFVVGFGSHFLLDAIPHWDYSLASMKKDEKNPMNNNMTIDKNFFTDLLKIGIDTTVGFLLSFILLGEIFHHSFFIILLGAIGGVTPDALQFFYFKWRHEPLISLQRFHVWIHSTTNLNNQPIIGIPLQAAIISLVVIFLK